MLPLSYLPGLARYGATGHSNVCKSSLGRRLQAVQTHCVIQGTCVCKQACKLRHPVGYDVLLWLTLVDSKGLIGQGDETHDFEHGFASKLRGWVAVCDTP